MKTRNFFLLLLPFACFLLLVPSFCHGQSPDPVPAQQNIEATFPQAAEYAHTLLTYQIIDAPNNTFCYDVYAGGRLMIHQSSIPGLPGNEGFKSKDDASKVAEMVMYKIRNGEMPPTVSIDELKNLGVIK